jgi:selT/selW/selH-like putative selenoprotein
LKKDLGIETELIKGRGGVFDVIADEQLIYSKKQTGRFPEEDDIVEKVRSLM